MNKLTLVGGALAIIAALTIAQCLSSHNAARETAALRKLLNDQERRLEVELCADAALAIIDYSTATNELAEVRAELKSCSNALARVDWLACNDDQWRSWRHGPCVGWVIDKADAQTIYTHTDGFVWTQKWERAKSPLEIELTQRLFEEKYRLDREFWQVRRGNIKNVPAEIKDILNRRYEQTTRRELEVK